MSQIRQKMAIKKILDSKGKIAVRQAMLESGYPATTAKNPQQLTKSKTWLELMDEYLPDSLLAQQHQKLIKSQKEESISKGVDMGYKLKGRYAPERILVNEGEKSLEELEAEVEYWKKIREIRMKNGK